MKNFFKKLFGKKEQKEPEKKQSVQEFWDSLPYSENIDTEHGCGDKLPPKKEWKCINCSETDIKKQNSWDKNYCDFCWHCLMASTF